MKNLSIVLNVVLFVAVIVLYVLYFSGHKSPETAMTSKVAGTADATKIVYINTDTLLNNYQLAVELNEAFLKKQEDRRTELNIKAKAIDQEGTEFQRKLQNNGFISEARAIEARDQLLVKQQRERIQYCIEYSVGWKCFICRGWFRYHERDCRSLECQLQKGR